MKHRTFLVALCLFALSGATSLIYEAVWARYLKLIFGHAAYGQTLTLFIFLGGIGVGAICAGRRLSKIRSLLTAYIITELTIAAGAFLYHPLYLVVSKTVFSSVFVGSSALLLAIIKLVLCLLMTLPWAFAIGATFPFMASAILRRRGDKDGWTIPLLYAVNALGGAIGILAASFWLLSQFGTVTTLQIAGLLNVVIAFGCWRISRGIDLPKSSVLDTGNQLSSVADSKLNSHAGGRFVGFFLSATFFSSAASFIYEIGWIRLLGLVLGSSTHTFDLVVAVFIGGLAFGGLFSRYLIRSITDSGYLLGAVQVLMGLAAAASVFTCTSLFRVMNASHSILAKTDLAYAFYNFYKMPVAVLLMFPACFCAGMTLPLVIASLVRGTGSENYTGYAYGLNTLGSIVGVSLGAMFFLPVLQLKNTILVGAGIDIFIGIVLLFRFANKAVPWAAIGVSLPLLIAGLVFDFSPHVISSGVYRKEIDFEKLKIADVTVRDGKTSTIALIDLPNSIQIATNGKMEASVSKLGEAQQRKSTLDDATMAALAYIPMQTRQKPYDVALIGLGAGMTAHHMLTDPLVKSVDIIEIEETVIDLARSFAPYNSRVYSDNRVRFIVEDARTYFARTAKIYDLIISEPSNPWVSGVADLFTLEFYAHVKKRLNKDGVLAQWLHVYEFNNELFLSVLQALHKSFKYADIFETLGKGDVVILSSARDPGLGASERVWQLKTVQDEWNRYGWAPKQFGRDSYQAGIDLFVPFFSMIEANSDFKPVVDLRGERAFYTKNDVSLLATLSIGPPFYHQILDQRSMSIMDKRTERTRRQYTMDGSLYQLATKLVSPANNGLSWKERRKRLTPILMLFMKPELWSDLKLVEDYRRLLENSAAPELNKVNLEFIEAYALNDNEKLAVALDKMLTFKPTDFTIRDLRIAAFYLYRTRQVKKFEKLMDEVVGAIGSRFPLGEKLLLEALLEKCLTTDR